MSDFIFKGGVKAFLDILYSNRLSLHGKVRAIFFIFLNDCCIQSLYTIYSLILA